MAPWVETIITVLVSVMASSGFWGYIMKRNDKKSAKTRLLVGLAHDRILQSGGYYLDRGWISYDEYENLHDYLYLPYKELGGNGTAEKMMEALKKLDHHPPSSKGDKNAST